MRYAAFVTALLVLIQPASAVDGVVRISAGNYGAGRVHRVIVTGEPQRLTEIAYLDELRNTSDLLGKTLTVRVKETFGTYLAGAIIE